MKRLILCGVAILLTASAVTTRPVEACSMQPCVVVQCRDLCIQNGFANGVCVNPCPGCHCVS
jgi:hypothetical protein